MSAAELQPLVTEALDRLRRRLLANAPTLAELVRGWTGSLVGGAAPERYFTHPDAFPMLLLPWWAEEVVRGVPDRRFQADLAYSSVCGYYFVRMIDDLMDGDRTPPAGVLPALTVLHTEFLRVYHRYFGVEDPFWEILADSSLASAELAARDAVAGPATRDEFVSTSARKTIGARIPVAAVALRYGRAELQDNWFAFIDRFGCWHQMLNDLLGWRVDLEHGRRTYLLSGAPVGAPDSVGEWMVREGLEAGFAELDGWMAEAVAAASVLGAQPVLDYLALRQRRVEALHKQLTRSLAALRRLAQP